MKSVKSAGYTLTPLDFHKVIAIKKGDAVSDTPLITKNNLTMNCKYIKKCLKSYKLVRVLYDAGILQLL